MDEVMIFILMPFNETKLVAISLLGARYGYPQDDHPSRSLVVAFANLRLAYFFLVYLPLAHVDPRETSEEPFQLFSPPSAKVALQYVRATLF